MKKNRKFQISNGHYIDFDQIARLLHAITFAEQDQKISTDFLEQDTGLPFRQVRNRISIARSMGLLKERSFRLTSFGSLVVRHDPFFEMKGSLEYVHYLAAGNYKI